MAGDGEEDTMTLHRHCMPFGAQLCDDARVRFRLWAPGATRVAVALESGDLLPMAAAEAGFYELSTDAARAGSRYRFVTERGIPVPDPASRFQPQDVHGPSEVIDPAAYAWQVQGWRGRPWEEAVIYELHVGAFSPEGTFAAASRRLDHIAALGATAIELMPIADFPGKRNWGYDGVLWFAPDSTYGRPEDLKALVDHAHACGLMVFLDVVHNHFGPEGNYLHLFAPQMFIPHRTPWGEALSYSERIVRDFAIHNALYWITEYQLDGLRLDAVDAIVDRSDKQILVELADAIRGAVGTERQVHLILENDDNIAGYLARSSAGEARRHTAQWNDDFHHVLQHLCTGDRGSYYDDFTTTPSRHLGRALSEGFAYQGEEAVSRQGRRRGQSTAGLPFAAFVNYLQSHDQVGNRALGERMGWVATEEAVRAAVATLLLAPSPVMLFMGEEWGCTTPFCFFCDLPQDLGTEVANGRRRELARFSHSASSLTRRKMLLPNDPAAFSRSKLDWDELDRPVHQEWLAFYRSLLRLRREELVPRLTGVLVGSATVQLCGDRAVWVQWHLNDGATLTLAANFDDLPCWVDPPVIGEPLFIVGSIRNGELGPWSVAWFLMRTVV